MHVEFAVPSPSDSSTDYYQLDMASGPPPSCAVGNDQQPLQTGASLPSHAHRSARRNNTFNGASNEEEQRNIISLRYRADRYARTIWFACCLSGVVMVYKKHFYYQTLF